MFLLDWSKHANMVLDFQFSTHAQKKISKSLIPKHLDDTVTL